MAEGEEEYVQVLESEREMLEPVCNNTIKLLNSEIERLKQGGATSSLTEIHNDNPKKYIELVEVPQKDFPKFNFVGRILGPGGNTLKQLAQDTGCKYYVLGRGCMRDKQEEERLRTSDDPKYSHLQLPLHVKVEVYTTPAEAHRRLAIGLAELKKLLRPEPRVLQDNDHHGGDDIRQQQTMGLGYHGSSAARGRGRAMRVLRGRGMRGGGGGMAGPRGVMQSRGRARGRPMSMLDSGYSYEGQYEDQYMQEAVDEMFYSDDYDGATSGYGFGDESYNGNGYSDGFTHGKMKPAPGGMRRARSHPYGAPMGSRGARRPRARGRARGMASF